MRKFITLLLCLLSLTTFAQTKVAVYVAGDDATINKVLRNSLTNVLVKSEDRFLNTNFSVIERQESFLKEIMNEQSYQRTGAVDDEEIAQIGKQFSAQLVCVVTVSKAFNKPYISARMIDVETAEIEGAAAFYGVLESGKQIIEVGEKIGKELVASLNTEKALSWKKVAVYVIPNEASKPISHILGDQFVAGFAKAGRFVAIERTDKYMAQLSAEHAYQRTGAVDDATISRLGKQYGADYVCVVDVTEVMGDKYVSARMIDVESAAIINTHEIAGNLDNWDDCVNIANTIADKLSKGTYYQQRLEEGAVMSSIIYPDWVQNHPSAQLPKWFMDVQEGSYVGISAPAGDELDAIGMALIQKLFAMDHYPIYNAKYKQDSVGVSRKEYVKECLDSAHISITATLTYNIQELTQLPSGEYICRITDGHRNRVKMIFTADYIYADTKRKSAKKNIDCFETRSSTRIEYKHFGCKSLLSAESASRDGTAVYESAFQRDYKDNNYHMVNKTLRLPNSDAAKCPYIFPQTQAPHDTDVREYRFPFDPNVCLAEQLLQYYVDLLRLPLPRNHKNYFALFDGLVRHKTPIVGMRFDNNEFIIYYRQ